MNVLQGDTYVQGFLKADGFQTPNNSVGNAQIFSGDPIAATKQDHQYPVTYTQKTGTDVVTERRPIHIAHADGTIAWVEASMAVASTGDSTVVIDVLKNGVSILSGTITLDSGDAAYAAVNGAIASAGYLDGAVFEVSVTATIGTGNLGEGLIVQVLMREKAGV